MDRGRIGWIKKNRGEKEKKMLDHWGWIHGWWCQAGMWACLKDLNDSSPQGGLIIQSGSH